MRCAELRDLAARLRLAVGHLDVVGAVGVTLERLVSAEMEFLRARLAVRPLAGPERRRPVVEQAADVQDFLRSAHDLYPIRQNVAARNICCTAT